MKRGIKPCFCFWESTLGKGNILKGLNEKGTFVPIIREVVPFYMYSIQLKTHNYSIVTNEQSE